MSSYLMSFTFIVYDPCDIFELPLFVTSSATDVARYVGCSREHASRTLYKAIRTALHRGLEFASCVPLRTFAIDIIFD